MKHHFTLALALITGSASVTAVAAWEHPSHMTTEAIAFAELARQRPDLIEPRELMMMRHTTGKAGSNGKGDTRIQFLRGVLAMYDDLMEKVVAILEEFYPNAEVQSLRESVQLLAIVSEGTSVLFGTRSKRAVSQERMIEMISQVLDSVARGKPC